MDTIGPLPADEEENWYVLVVISFWESSFNDSDGTQTARDPPSKGGRFAPLLVVIDSFTRFVALKPTKTSRTFFPAKGRGLADFESAKRGISKSPLQCAANPHHRKNPANSRD